MSLPVTDTLSVLASHVFGGSTRPGDAIVWEVRTPRVLLGALAGAGLSATGVAVQAHVRDALADPYLLGVSSEASVGATAVLLCSGRWPDGHFSVRSWPSWRCSRDLIVLDEPTNHPRPHVFTCPDTGRRQLLFPTKEFPCDSFHYDCSGDKQPLSSDTSPRRR